MGGRGSASGIGYSFRTSGSADGYQKQANEIIGGVKSVLSDFGMQTALTSVNYSNSREYASVNGMGQLSISKSFLKKNDMENESNGYHINRTYAGVGAHEAGHLVSYQLLTRKVIPNASNIEKATAWSSGKLEKSIIKEATRRYGSNPIISKYASKNAVEKVAEAVSDVYTNKGKANPFSKQIVSVMKDVNSGKFKPKIKTR